MSIQHVLVCFVIVIQWRAIGGILMLVFDIMATASYITLLILSPPILKIQGRHPCSSCLVHVEGRSHHCQWLNRCIGRYNRHVFMYFLFSLLIICSTTIIHFISITGEYAPTSSYIYVIICLTVFVIAISLGIDQIIWLSAKKTLSVNILR